MSDYTIGSAVQLLDWSLLDDIAGTQFLEGGTISSDTWLETKLMIDMTHADANDAETNNASAKIWIKGGTTNDDWHLFMELTATAGQATEGDIDSESAGAQPNVYVVDTGSCEFPGKVFFIKDVGTLVNSALAIVKDWVTDDYVIAIDNLANTYDTSDVTYDIVNQWTITIPATKAIRITFHNPDADATYACRIQYEAITGIE